MIIYTLASSSKGNSTYININGINILIDVGITNVNLVSRLELINIQASQIDYLFITHTHSDHIKGLEVFLKKNNPTIISSKLLINKLKEDYDIEKSIVMEDKIVLKTINITKIQSSHDDVDCIGFLFEYNKESLVYITDTGYINSKCHKLIENKNIYMVESNYDDDLMLSSSYPHHLKMRIISDSGHLSNIQCANYLKKVIGSNTEKIILLHLSEENNDELIVEKTINKMIEKRKLNPKVIIASKNSLGEKVVL